MTLKTMTEPKICCPVPFECLANLVVKLPHIESWGINVYIIAPTFPDSLRSICFRAEE